MNEFRQFSNPKGINLEQFKRNINSAGIYDRTDIEWYDKFNRFGCIDPYNVLAFTKEYLFFTKPDLHLFKSDSVSGGLNEEIANYPFFDEMYKNYPRVLQSLQISVSPKKEKLIKVLTNSVQNTLDIPGVTSRLSETSQTIYGVKQTYRSGQQGNEDIDFSLEFEDTKYLELYMLFKCWSEYSDKKSLGLITPPDDKYIINKELHDQIAIYKFIVGEDGETIIHYSKLYGCYPTGIPREAFSDMNRSNGLTYSVPWRAFCIEDMDPIILRDFNELVKDMTRGNDIPLYDYKLRQPNPTWANSPYIYTQSNSQSSSSNSKKHEIFDPRKYTYKLKWR